MKIQDTNASTCPESKTLDDQLSNPSLTAATGAEATECGSVASMDVPDDEEALVDPSNWLLPQISNNNADVWGTPDSNSNLDDDNRKRPATGTNTSTPMSTTTGSSFDYDRIRAEGGMRASFRESQPGKSPVLEHLPLPLLPPMNQPFTQACGSSTSTTRVLESLGSTSVVDEEFSSFVTLPDPRHSVEESEQKPAPSTLWSTTAAGTPVLNQDVIACYDVATASSSGACTCRCNHPGTLLYQHDLNLRHGDYARAKNDAERVVLCRDLVGSVWTRQGRFWIHASSDESLRLMGAVEIEKKLLGDLTQPCFVTDICKERDVLLGRGAHCTNNVGHQRFLDQKDALRPAYKAAVNNEEKTCIAQELVDWVYANGGCILKELETDEQRSSSNQWYVVDNETALRKAKQRLREPRKAPKP